MASRTKKSTTTRTSVTRTTHSAAGVGDNESYDNGDDSRSSSRRSFHSRADEKKALSDLNDRLANYIEKVRSLELENNRLQVQIRETEVVERRERENSNNEFKQKINDLRKQLDAANAGRNRAELDRKKLEAEVGDLRKKLEKAERDLAGAVADRDALQDRLARANSDLNSSNSRRIQLEKDQTTLRNDLDTALKQNDALKTQLEDETLLRSELQNKVDDLLEDLRMEQRNHQNELDEVYRKREIEMNTIGEQLQTDYNKELQNQIQQLRAESDARIRQSRQDTEDKFSDKLKDLQDALDYNREQALQLRHQLSTQTSTLSESERERNDLNRRLDALRSQLKDVEGRLQAANDLASAKDDQIADLKRDIARLTADYKDLMDIKLQLDEELSTYDMLLHGEESRLKLVTPENTADDSENLRVSFAEPPVSALRSPSRLSFNSSGGGGSPRRGVKRRRLAEEEYNDYPTSTYERRTDSFRTVNKADGPLNIDAVDPEGGYVRLENKGDEDLALSGYKVIVKDGEREVTYKFGPKLVLKPGKQVTIFSASSGERQHLPSHKLVLKNQNWPAGNNYRLTEVFDVDNEKVAHSESYKDGSGHSINRETDERCSIM
ncbi:hypothetical protein M3Y97_01105200 [Aphelenchoides bicaudatus]|nr:hypothetical protein M3Y97_01105200 [Aphelenchoides bicaudatus]